MTAAVSNCAVVAIHNITGEAHQDIVDGIAAFPDDAGSPAFQDDGVHHTSLCRYLEARGWTELLFEDNPLIPMTCLIWVPGHAFSLVNGRIFDAGGGTYFDVQIISVFVPNKAAPRGKRWSLPRSEVTAINTTVTQPAED